MVCETKQGPKNRDSIVEHGSNKAGVVKDILGFLPEEYQENSVLGSVLAAQTGKRN